MQNLLTFRQDNSPLHSADLRSRLKWGEEIKINNNNMKTNIKIGLISLVVVIVIFGAVLLSSRDNSVLGAISDGDYTVVTSTSNNWKIVSHGPAVLHKIIVGNANDEIYIANDTTTPSTNGAFYMKPTVPASFDFETLFSRGIEVNVTSTKGVIFVTSPQ